MVERKFQTIMGRGRAMMNLASLDENYKRKLWCETMPTATKLYHLMVRKMGDKPLHFKIFNEHPRYKKHLRTFGEMAVVATHDRKKKEQ